MFLAVCYNACDSRPVRVHPAGCGCDEAGCEYARVRDSFCFKTLPKIPEYQTKSADADAKWLAAFKAWSGTAGAPPEAPCPDGATGDCVVLAKITLPAASAPLESSSIDNSVRRVLYSAQALGMLLKA
jgi:hypothetical protein